MDHKQFDEIIKKKLEDLQPEGNPAHWSLLEEQLDAEAVGRPEPEDHAVDATLFQKLHKLEVPYQPSHWSLMVERIGLEFQLRGQIIRYKLLELALMLLLIFTFYNVLPDPAAKNYAAPGPQATLTPDSQETLSTEKRENASTQNSQTIDYLNIAGSANSTAGIHPSITKTKQSTSAGTSDGTAPSSDLLTNISDENPTEEVPVLFNAPNLDSPERSKLSIALLPVRDPLLLNISQAVGFPKAEIAPAITAAPFQSPVVETLPLDISYSADIGLPAVQATTSSRGVRLGMYGSTDFNLVHTASNEEGDFEGFSRRGYGYGGGLSIGFEMGRWELETGFMYSAKQYAPWILQVQGDFKEGYTGVGLKNTELNLISLPLNLRYNVFRHRAWQFYALAGANIHVSFQSNYYTDDAADLYNKSLPPPSLAPGTNNDQPSKFDPENLSAGWFEGGTFRENFYLTGSIGVGVERYLSNRWSIFAQPTYYQSISYFRQGIGPNRDRIDSYSLLLGVKVKL